MVASDFGNSARRLVVGASCIGTVCLFLGGVDSSWVRFVGLGKKKTILHSFSSLWVFTPGHGVLSLVFMTFLFCSASYTHFFLYSIFITYSIYLLSYIHVTTAGNFSWLIRYTYISAWQKFSRVDIFTLSFGVVDDDVGAIKPTRPANSSTTAH